MKTTLALIKRNRKLFFRDKGMLISSLITPIILIVLYGTFLANIYRDSFLSALPDFFKISDKLVDGTVASQLAAGLLAVSCVTVTFCVNLTMIQDRASGARKDFNVSPVKRPLIYLGYFFFNCAEFLNGKSAGFGIVPWLYWHHGMVFKRGRCFMADFGRDSSGPVWKYFIQHCLLPFENPGTDVSCGNHCKCRIWFYMWCIYAYF